MSAHLREQWRRLAFATQLTWTRSTSGNEEVYTAIHHGVRFVLSGSDKRESGSNNWGKTYSGGWTLDILEPGDRVQMGLPWRHRDPQGYEGKRYFDTLAEAQRYVTDTIIGGGMIDEMIVRDVFPPGSIRYHVTLASLTPSILSRGLEPRSQVGTGASVFSKLRMIDVILWDLKDEDWAAHSGSPLALLELDLSGLLRSTVKSLASEERVNTTVPPSRIKVIAPRIPWYLTESRFSTGSLSDAEILRLLSGDKDVARRAWVGLPEEFEQIVARVRP